MEPTPDDAATRASIREARAGDEAGIARTHIAGWRVAYRGVISDTTLDALELAEWTARWRERLETWTAHPAPQMGVCFVAVDAQGEIIGFAHGGKARPRTDGGGLTDYDAELYAIYLAAGMQGRGLGRRLARAVAERLAAEGFHALLIFALIDNPYRRFYTTLGGSPVLELDITIFGQPLREIGYGWPDIHGFIARAGADARQNA